MTFKFAFKVVVYFVIAIARLRFPRNKSIATIIRCRYGTSTMKLIRKFERNDRKLRKAELDLSFLLKCKELSVIPKFLNFKVCKLQLRNSPSYETNQINFLNEEIKIKTNSIENLRKEEKILKDKLQSDLNCIDFAHVVSCFLQSNDKFISEHHKIQDKKLCTLLEKKQVFSQ